jgi:hypothetical protein
MPYYLIVEMRGVHLLSSLIEAADLKAQYLIECFI